MRLAPLLAAMSELRNYLMNLATALDERDGVGAADLLSIKDPHADNKRLVQQISSAQNLNHMIEQHFMSPFDEVVGSHLLTLVAYGQRADFVEAYSYQSNVVQAIVRMLQSQKEENWSLPIMFVATLDLRLIAIQADHQIFDSKGGSGSNTQSLVWDTLEKSADLLMQCFRVCASDSRAAVADSKKWGMLNLVNQLFKIYFKVNKLHLCRPLIRAIDQSNLKEHFARAQLVTYKFYVGKKHMFDSEYRLAEESLSFAFLRCHKGSRRNKKLILIYLIPVKMLLGQMPKMSLLKKYDLTAFADVAQGVKSGDMRRLDQALAKNETFFIKCGIYLILEKLKTITMRNLFKKVYLILKVSQLPISAFVTALRSVQPDDDIDSEECECLLANLIYEGKIKGYISHQHQKLVVSKQNPFPALLAA